MKKFLANLKIALNKKSGFALLFSITLAGIIFTIAMGILQVTVKQLQFATSAKSANDAFFAADVGAECALLQDKTSNDKFPLTGPATSFSCLGNTITPSFSNAGGKGTYNFTVSSLGTSGQGCSVVSVEKDPSVSPTKTTITAQGYNFGSSSGCAPTGSKLVERRLKVTFNAPPYATPYTTPLPGDPPFPPTGDPGFITGIPNPGSVRNNADADLGGRVLTKSDPLIVTALGRIMLTGNNQTHTLRIVRASDSNIIASVNLNMSGGTVGQFKYANLSSPVTLAANTLYFFVSSETGGGDSWYNDNTVVATTSVATLTGSIAGDALGHSWSGGALVTNKPYVPVDFKYSTGSTPSYGDVVWVNPVGVNVSGNNLTKTAATDWGNAGAVSSQTITSGNGYIEFTANENNKWKMGGLGNGDSNANYPDIEYAVYLRNDGFVSVFESVSQTPECVYGAASCTTTGSTPYVAGDVLRVVVESGQVKYYKNGTLFYSSTRTASYPLLFDTALYDSGSTISNAKIYNTLPPPSTSAPVVSITATPTSVTAGNSSTLNWSATNNPTSCTASGGWSGSKSASGSQSTGNLSATTTFTLSCTNAEGTGQSSATVTVTAAPETAFITDQSVGSLRNPPVGFPGWVGMKFTTGASPIITINSLGRWMLSGNSQTHTLKLVKSTGGTSGTDVPGGSVSINMSGGTVGQYKYVNLASPVTLEANTTYYLVTHVNNGGDQWYEVDTGVTPTSVATVESGVWQEEGTTTWNAYGSSNHSYGPLNFKYQPGSWTTFTNAPAAISVNGSTIGDLGSTKLISKVFVSMGCNDGETANIRLTFDDSSTVTQNNVGCSTTIPISKTSRRITLTMIGGGGDDNQISFNGFGSNGWKGFAQ